MDTRLMLRSIALAVGLTLGVGVILAVAILIASRGGSSGGGSATESAPCQFTGSSPTLVVYHAPVTDATQQQARLPGSVAYPVSQTHGEYVLIQMPDTRTAWADKRAGTLQGKCKNVPVDNTPLTAFPTLCTFTSTISVPLFRDSALTGAVGSVVPGTYPLIGINQTRYYLYLDANQGGWVLGSMGLIQGNCTLLPARPG